MAKKGDVKTSYIFLLQTVIPEDTYHILSAKSAIFLRKQGLSETLVLLHKMQKMSKF
jgi:hypothetical protein